MVMPEDELEDIDEDEGLELQTYESLATEEPARDVETETGSFRTVSEAEEGGEQTTDLRSILKALTPQYSDKKLNGILQPIIVSRVYPDNYLDSCKMTVISRLLDSDPTNPEVDAWEIIAATHGAHSIAIEGRGIADRLEIAGAAQEDAIKDLAKDLGI